MKPHVASVVEKTQHTPVKSQPLFALTLLVLLSPVVIFEKEAISAEKDTKISQNLFPNSSVALNQATMANSEREQLQHEQRTLLLAQVAPGIEQTSQENLFINTTNNTYEIFNPTADTVTELTIRTLTEDATAGFGSTSFIGQLNPTTNQFTQVITVVPNTVESFVVLPGENLTFVPGLVVDRRYLTPDPSLAGATITNPTTNPQLVNRNGVVETRISVITSNGPQRANVQLVDNRPRIEDNRLEVSDRDYNDNPYAPRLETIVSPIETVVTTNPYQTATEQIRTESSTTTTGGEQISANYNYNTQEQRLRQEESISQSSRIVPDVQTSDSEVSPRTGRHTLAPIVGKTGRINPDGSPEQGARPIGGELNIGTIVDGGVLFNAEVMLALNEKALNPVYAGLNVQVTEPEQRATAFLQLQTPPTFTDSQRNTRAKDTILFGRVGVGVINQPDGNVTIREYGETPITETRRTISTLQDNLTNTYTQQTLAIAPIQTTTTTNTFRDTTLTNVQSQTTINQYTSSLTGQTVVLSSNPGSPIITGSTITSELIGSSFTATTTPGTDPVNVGEPTLVNTTTTSQVVDSDTEVTEEAGSRRVTRREVDTDNRISPVVELRGGFAYKDFSIQKPGTFVASGSGVIQVTPDGDSYGVGGRVGVVVAQPDSNSNSTIYLSVDHAGGAPGRDTKVGVYVSLGRGVFALNNESSISIPDAETARRQAGVSVNQVSSQNSSPATTVLQPLSKEWMEQVTRLADLPNDRLRQELANVSPKTRRSYVDGLRQLAELSLQANKVGYSQFYTELSRRFEIGMVGVPSPK